MESTRSAFCDKLKLQDGDAYFVRSNAALLQNLSETEESKMTIREATKDDAGSLIRLRLDYLNEDMGRLTEAQESEIKARLSGYFAEHIGRDFYAMLAETDNRIVAAAFLVVWNRPSSPLIPTGKTGTVLNVFTYPEYRKKGIATKLLLRIIDDAKKDGVSLLDLCATPDGKPVYEKLGFVEPAERYTYMRLQLE